MGYKKSPTHHRDEISGIHVHDDVPDGTHTVDQLTARANARQDGINAAIKADMPSSMTDPDADASHPAYGNALSRMPKPSDFVSGSQHDRFGTTEKDEPNKKGGAPQKNQPATPGILPASKSRG